MMYGILKYNRTSLKKPFEFTFQLVHSVVQENINLIHSFLGGIFFFKLHIVFYLNLHGKNCF